MEKFIKKWYSNCVSPTEVTKCQVLYQFVVYKNLTRTDKGQKYVCKFQVNCALNKLGTKVRSFKEHSCAILSSFKIMIIFNNKSAEIKTKSADLLLQNYHNFERTEDCATVF